MQDSSADGNQWWFRFDEQDGKARTIPARHDVTLNVEAYMAAVGIKQEAEDTPLFRSTIRKTKVLTPRALTTKDIYRMGKRRLRDAGLPSRERNDTRDAATATLHLLTQRVPLDYVQFLAGHSDPRTTRLYDRRQKQVPRNIVERISV